MAINTTIAIYIQLTLQEGLPLKIDTKNSLQQQAILHQQQHQRIVNNANETEMISEEQASLRGHIHKGIVNITSSVPKVSQFCLPFTRRIKTR